MNRIAFALAAFLLATSASLASPLWSVLTDNPTGEDAAIATGVTYTADPPFANPADPELRRLIDRGGRYNDWNNTAGINNADQTLTFDLKDTYQVGRVQLQFDMPAKPAYVDISVADDEDGPWVQIGRITPEERHGWYELTTEPLRIARFVRMFFKLKEWGWYLREVKLWGVYGSEPGPDVILPTERVGDSLLLTRDAEARASIVVAADPTGKVLRAARDLQQHLLLMSGAVLPLRTDESDWTGTLLLVGPSRYLAAAGIEAPTGYPRNERVIVKRVGDHIALVGNDEGVFTGTEFAVQMLLERLGCGWFGPDELWHVVPNMPTVEVPPLDIDLLPGFSLRSVWIGQGKRWYLGGVPLRGGHAHSHILPPKDHFATNPQYYALIGGQRTAEGDWQLCTSNADVIRLTIERARAFFDDHPDEVMFSLSNNDCGGFCECEECARTGGNPGAQMLTFANAVASGVRETHPDKWVLFLAYWYTFAAPPEAMTAEPGVSVMIVGQGCHAHPADDALCPTNVNWTQNLRRWADTGALMGIYEWYIPGYKAHGWRRLPWVAGETAARDLELWRAHGVEWVTYESQTGYEENPYPLRWPLFYVAAKRMWDPGLSADEILTDACQKLYGPAAQPMRRYYRELEHAMRNTPVHSGIWNLPPGDALYTPDICRRLSGMLAEAAEAATVAAPQVRERIAAETAVWELAEQTLEQLRAATGPQPLRIIVNETPHLLETPKVTGALLRDIGGIGAEEHVLLVSEDGERPVADDEEIEVVEGMRFRSAPR